MVETAGKVRELRSVAWTSEMSKGSSIRDSRKLSGASTKGKASLTSDGEGNWPVANSGTERPPQHSLM